MGQKGTLSGWDNEKEGHRGVNDSAALRHLEK